MVRIAIVEASHWHVPLYLDGFDGVEARVVALSDSTQTVGQALSERLGAKLYADLDDLLKDEKIDFAFAFGRHVDMANIAHTLINLRIPFSLEKPCGMCAKDLEQIAAACEAAGVYVSVPYIHRFSGLKSIMEEIEGGLPSNFKHLSFRFIAGAPQRYENLHCDWMLDPSQSGGGALINLGGHFIDFFQLLTGRKIERVSAMMSAATHGTPVEDYAVVSLDCGDGVLATIETGYTYPNTLHEQREFYFSARSGKHYLRTTDKGLAIKPIGSGLGEARTQRFETETDFYYQDYAQQVLREWQNDQPPSVGLCNALEVMRVVEAAYKSASFGGTPVAVG